ncbi:hypothetical protein F9278_19255 [Streptomyces phaeolivaceus]|uniref:Uncharacterized protein n=1 Tax=Streptomyces phaeolivaceus TaxID=2653200 RepID=A0A5P8K4M5_9ACTN|nr:hypothetical protein [Streptomyces phaeolivaceus]QFQ97994.1 hypothetical protein F9278_19255 [Streptomyces phaeolivaceus]
MTQESEVERVAVSDQSLRKVPFSEWSEEQKEAWVHETARRQRDLMARRRAVVRMMEARGIPVTLMVRARLKACCSEELLLTWLTRASTAHNSADVFVPE